MAVNDFAIVVGINRYPYHKDLKGPQHDAMRFYKWVVDKNGGAVPRKNIKLLLSFLFRCRGREGPSSADIEDALLALVQRRHMTAQPLRRLYLFLAGHGIDFQPSNPAILGCNGDYADAGINHVTGVAWAERLLSPALFREVVLFMDCCRNDRASQLTARVPPFAAPEGGIAVPLRRLHGLATRWGQAAREVQIRPGFFMGKFSKCLLDALTGLAPFNTVTRMISGQELKDFVTQTIALFDRAASTSLINHAQYVDITGDLDELRFPVTATHPLQGNFVLEVLQPRPEATLEVTDHRREVLAQYPMEGHHVLNLTSGIFRIGVRGERQSYLYVTVVGTMCDVEGSLQSALQVSPKPL